MEIIFSKKSKFNFLCLVISFVPVVFGPPRVDPRSTLNTQIQRDCYDSITNTYQVDNIGRRVKKKYYKFALQNLRYITPDERQAHFNPNSLFVLYNGYKKDICLVENEEIVYNGIVDNVYVFQYYNEMSGHYLLNTIYTPDLFCNRYHEEKETCVSTITEYGFEGSLGKIMDFAYFAYALSDLTAEESYYPHEYLLFLGENIGAHLRIDCYESITSVYKVRTIGRRFKKDYYQFALTNLRHLTPDERQAYYNQPDHPAHSPYLLYDGFSRQIINNRYVFQYFNEMQKAYLLTTIRAPENFCARFSELSLTCESKIYNYGFQGTRREILEFAYDTYTLKDLSSRESFYPYEYLKFLGEKIRTNWSSMKWPEKFCTERFN